MRYFVILFIVVSTISLQMILSAIERIDSNVKVLVQVPGR